ncbi:MAG TPA: hypothetical protein VHF05_03310 [Candidatus Paceibacterota bacterium]|nr:hypothetical protein [Candidatus Paceibacterota bacterium]
MTEEQKLIEDKIDAFIAHIQSLDIPTELKNQLRRYLRAFVSAHMVCKQEELEKTMRAFLANSVKPAIRMLDEFDKLEVHSRPI